MTNHPRFFSLPPCYTVRHLGIFALVALALTAPPVSPARAADVAYPALQVCDPNFYKTLEDKAWMEAQREIQINQTVITKPASTLALSCFDKQISQTATASTSFSDVSNADGSKKALVAAFGGTFNNYYASNFQDPPMFNGLKSFEANANFQGACDRLNQLWASIKCEVADPTVNYLKPLDHFRTSAVGGKDVRDTRGLANCGGSSAATLASFYGAGMADTTDLATSQIKYGTTYFDKASPDFCAYNPKTGGALGNEAVCRVKEGNALVEKKCSHRFAVPTGVIMTYSQKVENIEPNTPVWSYACLNPGCYFDVSANFSKIKFSSSNPTSPKDLTCSEKPYISITK